MTLLVNGSDGHWIMLNAFMYNYIKIYFCVATYGCTYILRIKKIGNKLTFQSNRNVLLHVS